MENVENLLVFVKRKSLKNGCQMVDVDLIPQKNHCTLIVTTILHYKNAFIHNPTLILNTHTSTIQQYTKFKIVSNN